MFSAKCKRYIELVNLTVPSSNTTNWKQNQTVRIQTQNRKSTTTTTTTPHLTPLTLLKTSASYSMNTLPFLTRSHLCPNPAITTFVSFTVSVHTSTPKQLPPSPLPLFTQSLTTATLFITTCSSLRSPGSNRFRTLLHVLLSELPNLVTSLSSFGLCAG